MDLHYSADLMVVQEDFQLAPATSTSLSPNPNVNVANADWQGNLVDLGDGDSFYFLNTNAAGDIPLVYVGNSTIQLELLTTELLPLVIDNGGFGTLNLENTGATIEAGNLAYLDSISPYEIANELLLSQGATGGSVIHDFAPAFQLGSVSTMDSYTSEVNPIVVNINNGGTGDSEIETIRNNFQLGGLATNDLVSPFDLVGIVEVTQGGMSELAESLGTLSTLDFVTISYLDVSFSIPSGGTGESRIENVRDAFQLGSLSTQDAPFFSDLLLSTHNGGTLSKEIEGAFHHLQLGLLASRQNVDETDLAGSLSITKGGTSVIYKENIIGSFQLGSQGWEELTNLDYEFRGFQLISQGGLSAKSIENDVQNLQIGREGSEEIFWLNDFPDQFSIRQGGFTDDMGNAIQLGTLAFNDFIDDFLRDDLNFEIKFGGTGVFSGPDIPEALQLGSISKEEAGVLDQYVSGEISPHFGGTGAANIESAQSFLHLGALSTQDIYAYNLVGVIPIANGGTSGSNIETAGSNLGFGTIAYLDWADLDQVPSNLDILNGGTEANGIESNVINMQLGSLAFDEQMDTHNHLFDLPVRKGGISQNLYAQMGSLAFEEIAVLDYDLKEIVELADSGTGVTDINQIQTVLSVGSVGVEDAADSNLVTRPISISHGGTSGNNLEVASLNLQLGSVAREDVFELIDFVEPFQLANGGTGSSTYTQLFSTFTLGGLAYEEEVSPLYLDTTQLKWDLSEGGTESNSIETANTAFQLGSIAPEDVIGAYLIDVTLEISRGGVYRSTTRETSNFQLGSLAFADYFTNELVGENRPVSKGGMVWDNFEFGSTAFEDLVISYDIDSAASNLQISDSGTGATEIEEIRNNFQLGSLAAEEYVYIDQLGLINIDLRHGGGVGDTPEPFFSIFQLGALSTEEMMDNYVISGQISSQQGGLPEDPTNALQLGSLAPEDVVDINLFLSSIGLQAGGFGEEQIEADRQVLYLGSISVEDFIQLETTGTDKPFPVNLGGTGTGADEGVIETFQLGRFATEDIGYMDEAYKVFDFYKGTLFGEIETNSLALEIGSVAFTDIADDYAVNLLPLVLSVGGTSANDIDEFVNNLQLGSLSSLDDTYLAVEEIFQGIRVGGTDQETLTNIPSAFQMGSIAMEDWMDKDYHFRMSGDYLTHGLVPTSGIQSELGAMAYQEIFDYDYDFYGTFTILEGGLQATDITDFPSVTQLGAKSTDEIVHWSEFFTNIALTPENGGTGSNDLEEARNAFQLGRLAVEDYGTTLFLNPSFVVLPDDGGTGVSSTVISPFQLGSLAYGEIVNGEELPLLIINYGGTSNSDREAALFGFHLGALSTQDAVVDTLLSPYLLISREVGGVDVGGLPPNWDLGSLGFEDIIDTYLIEADSVLTIPQGGLDGVSISEGINNLQLGSFAEEDILDVYRVYTEVDMIPIHNGGTSETNVEDASNAFQLGRIAFDDYPSFSDVYVQITDTTIQEGFTGVGTVEDIMGAFQIGSVAYDDGQYDLISELSVVHGGSAATALEIAAYHSWQLGSVADENSIDRSDVYGLLSTLNGGTSASNIEGAAINLQLGSTAYLEILNDVIEVVSIRSGGTGELTIDDAAHDLQLGSLRSLDFADRTSFTDTIPVGLGATSANKLGTFNFFQHGALAEEDGIDSYSIEGVLYTMSQGGIGTDSLPGFSVPYLSTTPTMNFVGDPQWIGYAPVSEFDPTLGGSFTLNTDTFDPLVASSITSPVGHSTSILLAQSQSTWASAPGASAVLSLSANYVAASATDWASGKVHFTNFEKTVSGTPNYIGGFISDTGLSVALETVGADYAEYLRKATPDEEIVPGDIVAVFRNGTVSKRYDSTNCTQCPDAPINFLVASEAPSIIGGKPTQNPHEWVIVGFLGRVPAKVVGPVNQGDFLIPSGNFDGAAIAISGEAQTDLHFLSKVIGVAWGESSSQQPQVISVGIGLPTQQLVGGMLEKQSQRIQTLKDQTHRQSLVLDSLTSMINRVQRLISQVESY